MLSAPDLALPAPTARTATRRLIVPLLAAAAAVAIAVSLGGLVHPVTDAVRRLMHVSPAWLLLGAALEVVSLAGYVLTLSLVAGRATPRIGVRESAQITFAGAAATRLLPTAGAGGAALTVWTLRRAGLSARAATRSLMTFFVLLYAVFVLVLGAAGGALALGLGVPARGPLALATIPAGAAALIIALALVLTQRAPRRRSDPAGRLRGAIELAGGALDDAVGLLRSGDARLAGAVAYWCLDAAVLWTMLHALGAPPALPVVALAYFLGQVATTLPLPGSVSGGMAGVLIAFHVPAGLALSAVLAYRAISVWLPTPAAIASLPRLRATVAGWDR